MRKGFGIITAIIIMMTIAVLMSLMINLSSSTTKQTSDLYLRQQAQLLLRSSTEFALMAISGHNNNTNCVEKIVLGQPSNNPRFIANVDIWYIGKGIPTGASGCGHILNNSVVTGDSNLTAVIDVVVTDNNISTEPIRLHRRTIQKP